MIFVEAEEAQWGPSAIVIALGEEERSLRLSPTIGDPSGQSPLGRGGAEPAPEGDHREPEVKRLERGRGGEVKRL